MDNRINIKSIIISFMILFVHITNTECQINNQKYVRQVNDSLTLNEIIKQVVQTHPTVKVAEEAINNANARIGLAKTGYYPDADFTANYSNMGPVTKITIPDVGTLQLFPANLYSASINYRQVVYDFGRTAQNIELENENKLLSEQAVDQVKQKISLLAVNNYYTIIFLQAAIRIKGEQESTLNEHLDYIRKMMETGSATEYQVLSTQVKISSIESQKVDLTAALDAQQAFLNSLLGNDQNSRPVVKNDLTAELLSIPADSLLSYAFQNRIEVAINQERTTIAEMKYGMIKLMNKPMISFQASGGAKNGYVPYLDKVHANYIVGLGLRVPIFDGMKSRYNLLQAQSAITSASYESENTKRTISVEISEAAAYTTAAARKVSQFELQLKQAIKAYTLAEISFKSGTITNLDLLDANTSVSESRLLLLKARIDYAASIYKLKAAVGERLY